VALIKNSDKIVRVGCYIRVSTQEQAKEGYSIKAQTERLKSYCIARGWSASEIYTDPAYSGAKIERPALQKLISDVKNKKIDLVLVYKLDRLSRSQKDTLYLIEDVFIKNGIDFVSINENFDTSTAFGRAMIGILSVFAQLEREQIKERTQMGRAERAKSGLWHGGGNFPIGYDYIEATSELIIDEYEAMQVREIFDMYANNQYSFNKIKQTLNKKGYKNKHGEWNHTSTIKNVLKNSLYTGRVSWGEHEYQGKHQPIIEKELFDLAQKRLDETGWEKGETPNTSPFSATQLLSGVLFCKNCGARYFGSGAYRGSHKLPNSQKQYIHIYTCYSRAKTKKEMIKDPTCKNMNWKAVDLDQYVAREIMKLNFEKEFNALVSGPKKTDKKNIERLAIKKQIEKLDAQMSKTLDLLLYDNLPTQKVAERLEVLSKEKIKLETSLEGFKKKKAKLSHEEALDIIRNSSDIFGNGDILAKRHLINSLINKIYIDGSEVTIEWSFL